MNVLITGGTGFIGSFLTREIVNSTSASVILFDYHLNKKRIKDLLKHERIQLIQGDISNWSDLIKIFRSFDKIDMIYHFGSLMPPLTEEKLLDAFRINIQGSFYILECAQLFNVPKIIYSSSGAVYSPGVDLPVTEQTFRDPWTMYGVGKVCSEVIGTFYHRRKNINFSAIRFPALIGPGRTGKGLTIFANNIIQYPAQGEKAICTVEPDVSVPIIYIKEASQFLTKLMQFSSIPETSYNIEGFWLTAEELADLVIKEIPEAVIEYKPDPELSFMLKSWSMMRGDDNLVRKDLEYQPSFSPKELVRDFIREVRENPHYRI